MKYSKKTGMPQHWNSTRNLKSLQVTQNTVILVQTSKTVQKMIKDSPKTIRKYKQWYDKAQQWRDKGRLGTKHWGGRREQTQTRNS